MALSGRPSADSGEVPHDRYRERLSRAILRSDQGFLELVNHMALFGFNKQKVLANAEKYVQQGKLQNAISEYEKILKNDAKDLTVTNTVGDLYSRIGESDKATECFRAVGDAYASQGFTVKAIAMYKKICKLKPALESLLKLAELYSQQGLFNDARAQYLQVAEEFLKAGELENAVRIFQKILEMDPDNSSMRVRLAEVYVRLGKKTEAWQIFSAAAESLRSKGSFNEADEILQRMLKIDPGNTYALLMQGKNLLESGDAAGATKYLQKIADIDSNPDGLRDLLKAYLQTGQLSDAGAVANKLLTVHNDLTAISSFADALMQAGQYENALQVYDQHAERLLAENSEKVISSLHAIIGHVRENPDSLQKLLDLFHKAGDTSHVSEVTELLAHASVQCGELAQARDLYQKLANIEPQNPIHMQNYQQVVSQLSGSSGNRLITPEEAMVLLEDLEATAPAVHQHYSEEVALAVRSALTDAELFISYNMPAKALGPLLAALPMAPSDLRINQRLAALHTRAGRFAEAAVCCRTLQSVYSEADHPDEASRYKELAERYEERTSATPRLSSDVSAAAVGRAAAVHHADVAEVHEPEVQEIEISDAESAVPEFSVAQAADEAPPMQQEPAPEPEAEPESSPVAQAPWPTTTPGGKAAPQPAEAEFAVVEESSEASSEPVEAEAEIDLSSEWDESITVEGDASREPEVVEAEVPQAAAEPEVAASKADEVIEEIRFYISQKMVGQAMAALARLQTLTNDKGKLSQIRAEVEAAAVQAAEEETAVEPVVEEISAHEIPSAEAAIEEAAGAVEEPAFVEESPAVQELPAVAEAPVEPPEAAPEPVAAREPEPAATAGGLKEFVSDLESSLGEEFLPGTVAKPAPVAPPAIAAKPAAAKAPAGARKAPLAPPAPVAPAVAAASNAPVLGEFVADIEASLGEDFLQAAPVAKAQPAAPVAKAQPAPLPAPVAVPKATPPLAASAAASASPVAPAPPFVPAAPAWHAPKPKAAAASAAPAPAAKGSPFAEDASVDLAEMFGELKQDLEADVANADEDPETHYNLGIAFREMGLLDEAIGELQKACQSFDRGRPFPQIMQTYTWLAQCFLEKGVPEAAVRWYEKALQMPTIDGETRTALNYELAAAYETAGDKSTALKHFTDVYGSNIDYRDVAERIKALKS
jgi:tetratricopeptide (TPR) repeat protein